MGVKCSDPGRAPLEGDRGGWRVWVAGVDTVRGIGFQQACAIGDAIDLVTNPTAAVLRVEGTDDIVDYETVAADCQRLRVRQAKTRQAPRTWSASDIAEVLDAWAKLSDADGAELAFVSDGQLGKTGVALEKIIEAAKAGATQAELDAMAKIIPGIRIRLPPASLLRRVELFTRAGTLERVLDGLELRVFRLMERARVATTEDARTAVDRLFRRLFEVGGQRLPAARELSRQQILDVLGLTHEEVTAGGAWDAQARETYRTRVLGEPVRPDTVVLNLLEIDVGPRVLQLLDGPIASTSTTGQPPGALLAARQVVLVGPTGTGKTTTLAMVRHLAAEREGVPVMLRADGHLPGALGRRVHETVATVLGGRLTVGGAQRLLADEGLLLLVDGVSEVDAGTREALRHDLRALAAERSLRVVAAGRDLATTRSVLPDGMSASGFSPIGLSRADRRQIAEARIGHDAVRQVAHIEETLGDAVDNPLLFGMAVVVNKQGGPIQSRPQVYQEFLAGLAARAQLVETDTSFATLGMAWSGLLATSRRATDGYEWRRLLADALRRLDGVGAFAGHAVTANEILHDAQAMGLLTRPDLDAGLVPLHDSFADYLAGAAVARGWATLAASLVPAQDEQALFAVQIGGLDDALADRLAVENPLLACRVAALAGVEPGSADPERVGALLVKLVAGATLPPLTGRGGVRLLHDPGVLGIVLVDGPCELVDLPQFHRLAATNPSWLLPAGSGSLAVAVNVWASAVRAAVLPQRRLFPSRVPEDADAVVAALVEHETACAELLRSTVEWALPSPATGGRVLEALGTGVAAVVGDPFAGPFGRPQVPVTYSRGCGEILVVREGDRRVDTSQLHTSGVADGLLRHHPAVETARRVLDTLKALTARTWPAP
jgi:energy-coupling factor transporter ATP-binding protein EcfA2